MGKYKTIARARWTLDIFYIFMKKKEKLLYPTVPKWLCIYKISCSIREATTRDGHGEFPAGY